VGFIAATAANHEWMSSAAQFDHFIIRKSIECMKPARDRFSDRVCAL